MLDIALLIEILVRAAVARRPPEARAEDHFGAQNGDLYSKSQFLEPFRISRDPEKGPRGDPFQPKGLQRASPFSARGDLEPTLLFTKTQ